MDNPNITLRSGKLLEKPVVERSKLTKDQKKETSVENVESKK